LRNDQDEQIIDPWGQNSIDDYDRLFKEFGIEYIKPLLSLFKKGHKFLRRGIIFAHTDLKPILNAIQNGKQWSVLSGIKPSYKFHLGSLLTATEIVMFQEMGGTPFYCIADIEAYEDNKIPIDSKESIEYSIDNLADILALGLDPEKAYIYRQSREETVMRLAFIYGGRVTQNQLRAIYGEKTNFGLYMAALVQVGDILLPQHEKFGGPNPTVIPVGVDQAPHIRLSRDLARKLRLIPPSATFHKLLQGLDGSPKMSKRSPMSYFSLDEEPASITKKIQNALTGGRATAKEQRQAGGEPQKCRVYDLIKFHFLEDDKELETFRVNCTTGTVLCGECKKRVIDIVLNFVQKHQEKKKKLRVLAKKILRID